MTPFNDTRSWIDDLCREERLPPAYGDTVRRCILPLAKKISDFRQAAGKPVIVGVAGAQGSGKSTLCRFLENWLQRETGLGVATMSLDDLYLDRAERRRLAQIRHPLLATRGVPGTHDIALGERLLRKLTGGEGVVRLPVFDKANDDRAAATREVTAPVDVVLFEGWCVGARPQLAEALRQPVNALEVDDDSDGRWRVYVNERLATDYADLFAKFDVLVYLQVPSFEKVLEWRSLQERKLTGGMDAEALRRFVEYFERISRHMLQTMPEYAHAIIGVDARHEMASPEFRDWPSGLRLS